MLGDNDRNDAFGMVKEVGRAFGIWPGGGRKRRQKWLKSVGPFVNDNCQLSSPEYEDLINRPWFSRVWVLQEIGLASSAVAMCREDKMDWFNFWRMALLITLNRRFIQSDNTLKTIRRMILQ